MKNLILIFLFSFSFLFSSCSSEIDQPSMPDEGNTNIEILIPSLDDIRTRAFSDGLSVNNLKCYVYDTSKPVGSAPILVEDIPMHNYSGKKGAYYSLQLPKNSTFELVLLATSVPQDNSAGKLYYNQTARTLNVNYNAVSANDESLDCFWGVIRNVSSSNSQPYKVILKRPFAQLNIGTKDPEEGSTVAVSVNGVYSSMNVMDGSVNSKVNCQFPATSMITGQTFPVAGNDYLTMNYLLVNERTNVDVSLTANDQTNTFSCNFNTIPLQRNYQTNIYGDLFIGDKDFKVEIIPGYDGNINKDPNDPYSDYDIVLELTEDYQLADHDLQILISNENTHKSNTFQARQFADSNGIVKLTYQDLGIPNPTHISFESFNTSTSSLKKVYKLNISTLTRLYGLFENCGNLTEIHGIEDWDTSRITDMSYMFLNSKSLTSLDLSNFVTSNVMHMRDMFSGCSALSSLILSSFDTRNVVEMQGMFSGCSSLTDLDLSSFDTSNVTNMTTMFSGCSSLTDLDLSSFDTSSVTHMDWMFSGCSSLTDLDLSSFDTSSVTNMSHMIQRCRELSTIDLSSFDTTSVTDMQYMFNECKALSQLDLSNFNTSNVKNMEAMFFHCEALNQINVTSFDTSNVRDMNAMFAYCGSLNTLDLSSFDTRNVTSMSNMFLNCNAEVIWGPNGGLH